MQCPRCRQENPASHTFCRECGTRLARLEAGVQPPPSYADLQRRGGRGSPFRQVGTHETRKQEGTGLGLTLAKKFIELHAGRIWVDSKLGQGATFTFTLPVS
jgi:hypothetical protein